MSVWHFIKTIVLPQVRGPEAVDVEKPGGVAAVIEVERKSGRPVVVRLH